MSANADKEKNSTKMAEDREEKKATSPIDKEDSKVEAGAIDKKKTDDIEDGNGEASGKETASADDKTEDKLKSKNATDDRNVAEEEDGEAEEAEDEEEELEDEEDEADDQAKSKSAKVANKEATVVKEKSKPEQKPAAKNGEKKTIPTGKPLGAIALIDANIAKSKMETLQTLHVFIFEKEGKAPFMKKNIKKFDGFEFDADSDEYKKRLQAAEKLDMKKLAQTAEILELDIKGSKEELADRIFKFLLQPDGDEELPEEDIDEEEADDGAEEEEEASEDEKKKPTKRPTASSGRGRETSKGSGGRPKRATAGRGYQDNSLYVDYTSSEDEERVVKPRGRRRNDSDSGSDYNPSAGSDSDAGKRRSTRAPARGSRVSARNRRKQSSEEEDSDPSPSDDDFSDDEPKKKKAKPVARGRGRPAGRVAVATKGRGRKRKADTESEEEEDSLAESEDSERVPKKSPVKSSKPADNNKAKNASPTKGRGRPKREMPTKKSKREQSSAEEEDDEEQELGENESEEDEKPLKKTDKEETKSKEVNEKDSAAPPSEDDIKEFLKEILEEANLEEITMKTVCKKVYAKYPDHDLSHKKDFIKATVKSLIST
ncbi:protein DEK isoform X1 [Malaya genurostris]|uniref:protein DEK isoform X1 n=1 Tax=Malaya genurostris TaxID=325434 RepID=UPI0026F3EE92|nr:protein DEK isoform X1 [Malaya genurostris]